MEFHWVWAVLVSWVLFVVLPSVPQIRSILAAPLVVTDREARGDAVYVFSAGHAFRERLAAASDLYYMGWVPKIFFFGSAERSYYDFRSGRNLTPTEEALNFLRCRGIPEDVILVLDDFNEGVLGTLSEVKALVNVLPPDITRLVIVTSPAHTRRSLLTCRQQFPSDVEVIPYAATRVRDSQELYSPLWLEYFKLMVYFILA